MTSIRALLGLPVVLRGKRIGRVVDASLDQALRKLQGLYADCGLRGSRLIPAAQIRLLGEVCVLADGEGNRERPEAAKLRKVLRADGALYGAVTGALVCERGMNVEALEISRGFFEDFLYGREWLYRYAVLERGGDVLLMADSEGGDAE